jgi:hypothetical protein
LDDLKDNLSTHKRGLFRRKVSLHNMLSWSRECIPQPMLLNLPKEKRKAAIDIFKLVQQFMGDRPVRGTLWSFFCTREGAVPSHVTTPRRTGKEPEA